MKKIVYPAFAFLLTACADDQTKVDSTATPTSTPFSTDGKTVTVYTTADSTDYRLAATGTAEFKEMKQPLETQICVFVEPNKTFQTYLWHWRCIDGCIGGDLL